MENNGRGVGHGTLEKRGNSWRGRWMHNGKRYTRNLGVFNAANLKTERKMAQAALDREMAPFRAECDVEALAHISARMAAKSAVVTEYEEERPAMSLARAFDEYEKDPSSPDSSDDMNMHYRGQFDRFVKWVNVNYPDVNELRGVSKEIAFGFMEDLKEKVSANTYNKYIVLLVRIWKVLKERARLVENPWIEVKRRRLDDSVRRELSISELNKIAATAKGEMWMLFAIGIFTGLRLGDAVRLDWGSIDLARNVIRVEPSKTKRYTHGVKVVIPIVRQFRGILEDVPSSMRRGFVIPGIAELYRKDAAKLSNQIQRVFVDCGIETQAKEKGKRARVVVGYHSLRHTFVSIAAESGIPFAIVQSIVGHTSPAMTRHYTHISEKALQDNVGLFPSVFGGDTQVELIDSNSVGDGKKYDGVSASDCRRRVELIRDMLDGLPEDSLIEVLCMVKDAVKRIS